PCEQRSAAGGSLLHNVGYLGMCGHGMIGLMVTLAYQGRLKPGEHRIETSVGVVTATVNPDGSVSVENVPSYRKAKDVTVQAPNSDAAPGKARSAFPFTGDVAWGGDWFFLVEQHVQS